MQDLAFKAGRQDEDRAGVEGFLFDMAGAPNSTGRVEAAAEPADWSGYWRHHHLDEQEPEELYAMRAPGQLLAVYLIYCVPMFLVGMCGWAMMHWPGRGSTGAAAVAVQCH